MQKAFAPRIGSKGFFDFILLSDEQDAQGAGTAMAANGAAGPGHTDLLKITGLPNQIDCQRLDLRADAGVGDKDSLGTDAA